MPRYSRPAKFVDVDRCLLLRVEFFAAKECSLVTVFKTSEV